MTDPQPHHILATNDDPPADPTLPQIHPPSGQMSKKELDTVKDSLLQESGNMGAMEQEESKPFEE